LRNSKRNSKLELIFVGGLYPVKAVDLALRGAAPLLQKGQARFTILGHGPEQANLEQLTRSLGIGQVVSFCGSVSHSEVIQRLAAADVLVFPSVREFGGAVVFEALAMGAVPVVADFGGPGDIVNPQVGFKVSLTNENDVVLQIGKILTNLVHDPGVVDRLRQHGMRYARECLTWNGKARMVTEILCWATQQGPKPDLLPPKMRSHSNYSADSKYVAEARAVCVE
jgi:Glycosyltransferase